MTGPAVLVLLVLVLLALLLIGSALKPVTTKRVAQFVDRTGVHLTPRNAPIVADGLARTVRWRSAGVLVASSICLTGLVYSFSLARTATLGSGLVVVLACGFLTGAVVGEVGNAVHRGDGPRVASLARRDEADYVGPWARRIPAVAAAGSVVAWAVLCLHAHAVLSVDLLAGAVVPWLVARWSTGTILARPRPADDAPDVVAADDGLRSRGLHAVGGPVVLVGTWAFVSLVSALLTDLGVAHPALPVVYVVALLACARLAWVLAVRRFPVMVESESVAAGDVA
jgi:hypothetical protein